MTSVLNDMRLSWRERVFQASVDEPTERILMRILDATEYGDTAQSSAEEILAYINILRQRHSALLKAVL
jgi:hypothetical protein